MKNLILIFALVLSSIAVSSANTNPESSIVILKSETVTVSSASSDLISLASFNTNESSLDFETFENVAFVQIFNAEGDLEFQLPVSSDKIRINKNLFGTGQFKLGFLLENSSALKFAEVNIK